MQTERFKRLRRRSLEKVFDKATMAKVWRKIVKEQLRDLDILDIFDHYDFNYSIEEQAQSIRTEILEGAYKASKPLVYRIEKKLGICRHLIVPQPADALVLQVLIESVGINILRQQPSKQAFFSRDRHNAKRPHEVPGEDYSWRGQWKELQKQIYSFNETFDYITVTDVSNFYDGIDIRELRKIFSSYSQVDEVVVDLMFQTIEDVSWKPDYLPYPNRGLPTSNIEAIRLLAHIFLFEIDEVLKQKTGDNFTRWMDDIVIGSKDRKSAIDILSVTSDMLKSRGLALNLSKTNVYSAEEGYFHFQIEENRYLDELQERFKSSSPTKAEASKNFKKFKKHLEKTDAKHWDKVAKRYISFFGKHKILSLLEVLKDAYLKFPILRKSFAVYLESIGYSKRSADLVLDVVANLSIFDDISIFHLTKLVTVWVVPHEEEAKSFLEDFEKNLTAISAKRKTPSDFYCLLWYKAKYSHPDSLLVFISKYQNIWQRDAFLRRQVTATLSRLLYNEDRRAWDMLNTQFSSGSLSTVTLANHLQFSAKETKLNPRITMYLFNENMKRPFSVQRFLVLCSFLNSREFRGRMEVRALVKKYVKDPYYLKWIDFQYGIN